MVDAAAESPPQCANPENVLLRQTVTRWVARRAESVNLPFTKLSNDWCVMPTPERTVMRHARTLALSVAIALSLSACAANEVGDIPSEFSGTINGAGSSAMAAAQEAWIAEFQRNNAFVTVNFDPTGSGAGREAFLAGAVDYAGSDSALSESDLAGEFAACAPGTKGIDLPVYISPIAIIFNLAGVNQLNLDAATVAGIFKGDITAWDDRAIRALNPGTSFPSTRITAVHRSDDSGTTATSRITCTRQRPRCGMPGHPEPSPIAAARRPRETRAL